MVSVSYFIFTLNLCNAFIKHMNFFMLLLVKLLVIHIHCFLSVHFLKFSILTLKFLHSKCKYSTTCSPAPHVHSGLSSNWKPVVRGAMGCGLRKFHFSVAVPSVSFGFLAIRQLPRVSLESHFSLMNWMIMRWYQGLCTDLLAFALAEENPGIHQLGDCRRILCDQSLPQIGPFRPNEVGRIAKNPG